MSDYGTVLVGDDLLPLVEHPVHKHRLVAYRLRVAVYECDKPKPKPKPRRKRKKRVIEE